MSPAVQATTVVKVFDRSGAYVTATVRGKRASCTGGAVAAGMALACKLWPDPGKRQAEALPEHRVPGETLVRLTYESEARS
ncbi:hypothetical protein DBR47_00775 [Paucibacter sp. KBW04]|uniref:hypothetical protein n=1 Tax=Paucibacter sp. KBW04 TaxID=2153361 RepID=UPI000F588090|nr:hypothetical protein [Paucibacter sp. KBW04]RQO63139.1 hypothetical protein DBR47_00775 [Paucibacter sp. KBW04]